MYKNRVVLMPRSAYIKHCKSEISLKKLPWCNFTLWFFIKGLACEKEIGGKQLEILARISEQDPDFKEKGGKCFLRLWFWKSSNLVEKSEEKIRIVM